MTSKLPTTLPTNPYTDIAFAVAEMVKLPINEFCKELKTIDDNCDKQIKELRQERKEIDNKKIDLLVEKKDILKKQLEETIDKEERKELFSQYLVAIDKIVELLNIKQQKNIQEEKDIQQYNANKKKKAWGRVIAAILIPLLAGAGSAGVLYGINHPKK